MVIGFVKLSNYEKKWLFLNDEYNLNGLIANKIHSKTAINIISLGKNNCSETSEIWRWYIYFKDYLI